LRRLPITAWLDNTNRDLHPLGKPLDASLMPLIDGKNRTEETGIALHGIQYIQVKNFQIQNYSVGLQAWGENWASYSSRPSHCLFTGENGCELLWNWHRLHAWS